MKNSIKTFLFSTALLLFVSLSCSDEDSERVTEGGPFEISELAGDWVANYAFFVRDSDQMSVDIVADGGSLSLTVQSNGRCTFTVAPADREVYTVSGEMFWELYEGDYFFSIEYDDHPGDWGSYGATLTDTTFNMNGGPDSGEYDFNDDGTTESCSLGFEFIRD